MTGESTNGGGEVLRVRGGDGQRREVVEFRPGTTTIRLLTEDGTVLAATPITVYPLEFSDGELTWGPEHMDVDPDQTADARQLVQVVRRSRVTSARAPSNPWRWPGILLIVLAVGIILASCVAGAMNSAGTDICRADTSWQSERPVEGCESDNAWPAIGTLAGCGLLAVGVVMATSHPRRS